MDSDTARYRKVVEKLNDSLDSLEDSLETLLSKPLHESLADLGTLDQAKLNVLVPYMVHDLIFIYLKTRGVDPKTHPVVAELERIKQYFAKIKHAEDPEKRRLAIDRAAAGRFIRAAIAQAKSAEERELAKHRGADDEEKADQEQAASAADTSAPSGSGKRRRPAFDPFAGYGDTPSDTQPKRPKRESPAPPPAFKYNEVPAPSSSSKKGKAKASSPPPVKEEDQAAGSDSDDSDSGMLDVIDGDPGALVIEDTDQDAAWQVVKNKAREKKEKAGFGDKKGKGRRDSKSAKKRK